MPVFFPHSGRACDSQLIRVVAFGLIDMLFSSFAGEPLSETSDRAERVTRVILQVESIVYSGRLNRADRQRRTKNQN